VQVFNDARASGLAVVPEPSSALLALSSLGLACLVRRRTSQS
jgi:MYXO-CTERM domain-containing protein